MASQPISTAFDYNVRCWKILALWLREVNHKYYYYYSLLFIFLFFVLYDGLLTLNLMYCPKTVQAFVPELLFYFTSVVVAFKIHMIISKSKRILEAFSYLDTDVFAGETPEHKEMNNTFVADYKRYYLIYFCIGHISYIGFTFYPLINHLVFGEKLVLSVCNYYFLTEKERDDNIYLYWIFQSLGNYAHMTTSVNSDTFMPGLIFMGIGQFKALNYRLANIKNLSQEGNLDIRQERQLEEELVKSLRHYDAIRVYCKLIQEIFDMAMFVQFGVGAAINCVTFIACLQIPKNELFFLVLYGVMMTVQIFTPGYVGTQIAHESGLTTSAVYDCDWLERSASFKRNMILLVERANKNMILTARSMFPLSLTTFISIMKAAYSCFTLVRAVNNQETL
uniref:Odorant receptor n=1 Tax=Plutella xylostella TaxID=51655 RepID=A0A8G1GM48_PLUXY|nr:odorant receptor 42 [Plutella xylostella]